MLNWVVLIGGTSWRKNRGAGTDPGAYINQAETPKWILMRIQAPRFA